MTRWAVEFSCTVCGGGRLDRDGRGETGHVLRAQAARVLVFAARAARRGYPLAHRGCDGEMYDVRVVRAR